jgi:diketogulonate reductase-like aldo/keto reductase
LLAQKPFIVPIPGTRNIEHLNENMGALDVELTPAEVQQISTESDALRVYGERDTRTAARRRGQPHPAAGGRRELGAAAR